MALPNPFQHIKHGVILCKKNFATFVETFNFLVDFARNISGDGDNGGQGKINVDKTIPDRPVIRFNPNNGAAEPEDVHSIVGDTISSVPINGNVAMTGSGCGITVATSSSHEEGEETVPPTITIDVKDRDVEEDDWGAHEIKFTGTDGSRKVAHVLSCGDIEIQDGGGESGKIANVIGSDYISVDDKIEAGITKRQVKAKIATVNPKQSNPVEHALITHDTDQYVRCKKTFTGNGDATSSSKVIVDGLNGKLEVIDADQERKIELDAADIPASCSAKTIKVNSLTFKDKNKNTHTYHGLFCENIDMTNLLPEGKLISNVTLSPSSASGGFNTIVFYYTDGTSTTVTIQNGIDGQKGDPGDDGDTPEITFSDISTGVHGVYVDGELKAEIRDGTSPVVTMGPGVGTPKVYPVLSNGVQIGSVKDGADGTITEPVSEVTFITDITFSTDQNGVVSAHLTKKKGKVINLENAASIDTVVLTGQQEGVVVGESYSTSTRKFTNTKKNVWVIKSADASGETIFTATPHNTSA